MYPLLFALQAMQLYVGASVLWVVLTTYRIESHIMREWQASVAGILFALMAIEILTATLLNTPSLKRSFARSKSFEKRVSISGDDNHQD